jgi:hypothetical protein
MAKPVNNSRRQFITRSARNLGALSLYGIAGPLISGCSHKKFFNPDEDILLSGGRYQHYQETRMSLIVINLNQKGKKVIDCGFMPHGIYIHPKDKYRVYCFEKDGISACVINLQTERVEKTFTASGNRKFSGSAAFSADGGRIYVIEYDVEPDHASNPGSISILDSHDLSLVKQLPTLGLKPESCQLLADNTLVIGNTGSSPDGFHTPSLVFIDMNTEKLVKRIRLDKPGLNAGLFNIAEPTSVVVSGATNAANDGTSGISFIQQDDSVTTIAAATDSADSEPGQPSSMVIDEKQQTLAVTYPDTNRLTTWSINKRSLIKSVSMDQPRGVALSVDKQYYIASYGRTPSMIKLTTDTLEPVAKSYVQPTFINSTFLLNWSVDLRRIMPGNVYD